VTSEGLNKIHNSEPLLECVIVSHDAEPELPVFLSLVALDVEVLVVVVADGFESEDKVVGVDFLDLGEVEDVDVGVDLDVVLVELVF